MKKKIILTILLVASCAFTSTLPNQQNQSIANLDINTVPSKTKVIQSNIFYLQFAISDPSLFTSRAVASSFGIGYRHIAGPNGLDFFIHLGAPNYKHGHTWNFPKATYLRYLNPNSDCSLYLGAGVGVGSIFHYRIQKHRIEAQNVKDFRGLLVHGTIGYEIGRQDACVILTELTVSQPVLSDRDHRNIGGPSAAMSIGLGF